MQFKIKNWTINYDPEKQKNTFWIDDGWFSQSVIFYDGINKGKWACDFPERVPKYLKNFLYTVKL